MGKLGKCLYNKRTPRPHSCCGDLPSSLSICRFQAPVPYIFVQVCLLRSITHNSQSGHQLLVSFPTA